MNISSNHKIIPLAMLMVAVLLGSCSGKNKRKAQKRDKTTTSQARANQKPPPVKAPNFTIKKMNGDYFTLSKHKGQVIVINVWATWCPPCRKEIPDFIKIQKALRDNGVLFVGISLDRKGWKAVLPFAKNMISIIR